MTSDDNKNRYKEYFDNEEFDENLYYQQESDSHDGSKVNESGDSFSFKKMDKDRKLALSVLGVFSLLIIVIAFLNIRNLVRFPFELRDPDTGKKIVANKDGAGNTCSDGSCSAENNLNAENLDLKLVDTDGDGLSDWDELFIYSTSPYLEDTDGDGLSDYEEIFVYKTDPNCPEGGDCSVTSPIFDDAKAVGQGQTGGSGDLYDLLKSTDQSQAIGEAANSQLYNISLSDLRAELVKAGFAEEEINLISDEDLLAIYKQSLGSSSSSPNL